MPLASAIDGSWLVTALLLSLRLGPALAATPLLSAAGVPSLVRVAVVVGLSSTFALGLPGAVLSTTVVRRMLDDNGALLQAAAQELALGTTLALGIQVAFAALAVAGGLLGIQIGFGLGTALNPALGRQEPLLSAIFSQVGVLVFFLVDGHHALLRGLALSLERFPLGRPWPIEAAAGPILRQAAGFLGLGFALAAPVVLVVLLIDVALGVVARNLPQVNMLAVGIPVKMVAGLLALALWGPAMGQALNRIYAGAFTVWSDLLGCAASASGGLHG